MKLYKIKSKKTGTIILVSNQHYGFDVSQSRMPLRWHGLAHGYFDDSSLSPVDLDFEIGFLQEENRKHKYCLKFPWITKFNKNEYEKV